jgi:isocitrate dehydrogenase
LRRSPDYPDIENEHWIVDIGAAKLADTPEAFDVVVLPNLYGDILSDVAAQIAGSVGLAGSANIGEHGAMFEAIHGSAPRRAGQDVANPSGLLLGAVMMLVHIGQGDVAERVHNAWLRTLEDGVHTYDIFKEGVSRERVGTSAFADAVIARLGSTPERLEPVSYAAREPFALPQPAARPEAEKRLVGVDVFVAWRDAERNPEVLAERLRSAGGEVPLAMITNRGVKVWPEGLPETFCTDHWRCRFLVPEGQTLTHQTVASLLSRLADEGLDFIKTEHLYTFDGEPGYSLGQGQ